MAINLVLLTGNITQDPTLQYSREDNPRLAFSLALNNRWRDRETGEDKETVTFVPCALFGKRAEALSTYLHKGMKITVQGHLSITNYVDEQTGNRNTYTNVIVDRLELPNKGQAAAADSFSPSPSSSNNYVETAWQEAEAKYEQGVAVPVGAETQQSLAVAAEAAQFLSEDIPF